MLLIRKLVLFCIFLSISACGFHARGPVQLAPALHHLYIKTCSPYGKLARDLKQFLNQSGVYIAASPCNATSVLSILSETENEQLLSVSTTQQTRQYNLILTVLFQIEGPQGQVLVPPHTVMEVRAFTVEANQILADSNEANRFFNQMRQAIAYDIMNILSSRDVTLALMSKP